MPNRWIREDAITSERVNRLGWAAEVFWRRLLNLVDDFGRYTGNLELLRAAAFPLRLDRVSGADVGKMLLECEQADLVSSYTTRDGCRYIAMHRWEQGRAAKSKYPDPPEDIRAQLYALARNCKHPIADPPDPDPDPDPDQRQTPPNPRARANGREMAAPTLAEVLAEAGLRNYPPADAERFWHHFESSGWIDKNGHPIVKWQSKLATWVADSRARPAEAAHKNGTASVAQSILNEKELTRVEKQIDRIKGEYESHRDYTPGDKEKLANLTKRQRELKDALGFKA